MGDSMELMREHSKPMIRRSLVSRNVRNTRHEANLEPPNTQSLKDLKIPEEFTKVGIEVFLKFDGWHQDERIQIFTTNRCLDFMDHKKWGADATFDPTPCSLDNCGSSLFGLVIVMFQWIAEKRVTAHWAGANEPRRGQTYVDVDNRVKNTVKRYDQMPKVEFLQLIALNLGRIPVFKAPELVDVEVLANKFGIKLNKEQLGCLEPTVWLNGETVNFYHQMIVQQNKYDLNLPPLLYSVASLSRYLCALALEIDMAQELVQLNPGTKVERWMIDKKLDRRANEQIQVLKMEVFVLTELTKRASKHFCKIEDKGRFGSFNYVVMTLVGKSLQDLRKENPLQHFSMGTAIGAGIQTLEALEDLHGIGYLHRDVKPGNYTIGRAELNELRKIYILDFGMARKFTNDAGVIRRPRAAAGFRGTVRYAPISCHIQRELCRKDDIEVWVYMCVELTTGNLPWKNVQDMNEVGEFKKRVRLPQFQNELFNGCPREYSEILTYVDGLKYYDKPDYQQIYSVMRRAFTSQGVQEFPYDWEKPAAGGW
uniref:non-specific serine/threonine protein kinase n=3 Tax=Ditylenchus dipsaci TaxID=166011 RepID=A0A915DED6_9BILA